MISSPSNNSGQKFCDGYYNILFILTDQERYFDRYPGGVALPGHERLHKSGVTFTNHYIASVMCTSSRAVLYTGQHVQNNGMFDNINYPWTPDLSTDLPTLGNRLRRAGYFTAYKGKWHLSRALEPKGQEKFYTEAMEPYGFSDYNWLGDDYGHALGGYRKDSLYEANTIAWLRDKALQLKEQKKPWLLAVNLINPHDIMYFNTDAPGEAIQDNGELMLPIARAPSAQRYQANWEAPLSPTLGQPLDEPGRPAAHAEFALGWNHVIGKIPPEEARWRRFQDYYCNCLRDVDVSITRLLNELDDLGLRQNTIVVLTADHGEMAGAHGLKGKGPFAYEENIHVPLIIAHPALPGGRQCRALSSHLDIVPTLVGLAAESPEQAKQINDGLPGRDLSPLLQAPASAEVHAARPGVLFTYNGLATVDHNYVATMCALKYGKKPPTGGPLLDLNKRGAMRTLCDGRYKFSRYFSPLQHHQPTTLETLLEYNDLELFDLHTDPHEARNLASPFEERHKDLVLELNSQLNALIEQEIGDDDGSMLPAREQGDWEIDQFDP